MNQSIKYLIPLILLISCKTAEELKREQIVDNLAIQMVQTQKTNTESVMRLQTLEEKLGMVVGQIEETDHEKKEVLLKSLAEMSGTISVLKEKQVSIDEGQQQNRQKINELEALVREQKKYIEKVLGSLAEITGRDSKTNKKLSDYDIAMRSYKKGQYKEAENQFLSLINDKNIKGDRQAHLYHNLGMVEYSLKKYDQALTYFTKLYTQYPKSSYCGNGLVYMAKSFANLKRYDDAKQSLELMIKEYPKSRHVKTAKELLKKYSSIK